MPSKKAYRRQDVKDIDSQALAASRPRQKLWAGVDVSKESLFCVLRWQEGSFERPWYTAQPQQLPLLVEHLQTLQQAHDLSIALEPTGTYGDPLRHALALAALPVWRVSAKQSKDYAEVFDGTPSQHDGKDAAIVAELLSLGKAQLWPPPWRSSFEQRLRAEVEWLEIHQKILGMWSNRLEALLARHWPEATSLLPLTRRTMLRLLARWGGPQAWQADAQGKELVAAWGRGGLKPAKLEQLYQSAQQTLGVPQRRADQQRLRGCARQAWRARRQVERRRKHLQELSLRQDSLVRLSEVVGGVTACVLWAKVGDPREYGSPAAYRKALGLNLRERSSGRCQGQLHISKRGSSLSRRWLYYAALRQVREEPLRSWYETKKASKKGRGKVVLVALMRKLALACHAVVCQREGRFRRERLLSGL